MAVHILNKTLKHYGSETAYLEHTGGAVLTKDGLMEQVEAYLEANNLQGQVEVVFREGSLAPAAMGGPNGNTLIIGMPIRQRESRFWGVLDHEVGTHCLRRANDKVQVWHKANKKKKERSRVDEEEERGEDGELSPVPYAGKAFRHCLRTEEGLACINTCIRQQDKLLWRPALHYYAVCQGSVMSFSELYEDLSKYIDDPFRRWEQCVRCKRGFEDTSQPGAFAKDQVYLDGAMRILAERKELPFKLLYSGRVSLDDLTRANQYADLSSIQLPGFLWDYDRYKMWLDELAKQNCVANMVVPGEKKTMMYGHWTCYKDPEAERDSDVVDDDLVDDDGADD